jgi:hypothetical protein
MDFGYRKKEERVGHQSMKSRQDRGAMHALELTGSNLDRERRGKLCFDPVARQQTSLGLKPKPILSESFRRLVRERRDENRRVDVKTQ